jgi:hypothetical protein
VCLDALQEFELARIAAVLGEALDAALHQLEIRKNRLGLEVGDFPRRLRCFAGSIRKRAHHLTERIHLAHRIEDLALDAFSSAPAEIRERDLGVRDLLWFV